MSKWNATYFVIMFCQSVSIIVSSYEIDLFVGCEELLMEHVIARNRRKILNIAESLCKRFVKVTISSIIFKLSSVLLCTMAFYNN